MEGKYLKAIQAGLICAVLIIIIRAASQLAVKWAANKSSVQDWVSNQSVNSTPYATSMPALPPDVLLAGIAICGGGLLIFALYAFAGVLAAWYTAKDASGAIDLLLLGAIAGAVSQVVSVPFKLGLIVIMNFSSGGVGTLLTDINSWLVEAFITELVVFVIIAAVLAAVSALICGAMIKAFGKQNKV